MTPEIAETETTTEDAEAKERHEFVHGLRELAEMLDEADPSLPLPHARELYAFPEPAMEGVMATKEEEAAEIARLARAIPGRVEKVFDDGNVKLHKRFGSLVYEIFGSSVCERVQVGTKTEVREEPVETRTVTETVPVFEYRCPDSLLAAD